MNTKEKIEVMKAWLDGETIQMYLLEHGWRDFLRLAGEPNWNWETNEYRIKPKEVKKPSINWDHVSKEYNYLAVDGDGDAWFYTNKPKWHDAGMWVRKNRYEYPVEVKGFTSYTPPENCPPEESLIKRPSKGE